jgi:hypothetical protein
MFEYKNLQRGDILVQQDGSWWSRAAESVTKRPNPHSMIVSFVDSTGTVWIYEDKFWVKHRPFLAEEYAQGYRVGRPDCSQETLDKALKWIDSQVGRSYGYLNLFVACLRAIVGLPPRTEKDEDRYFICSELIERSFEIADDPLVDRSAQDTFPEDFLDSPKIKVMD